MFTASDSDDEEKNKLSRLAKARADDMKEEYDEEMFNSANQTGALKRGRESSSSESDAEEIDDEVESDQESGEPEAKKAKGMSVAERLMAKMGHVPGTGLGKEKQGIAEPISASTQRGRLGLGHEGAKAVSRDLNVTWDESMEQKTIEERVIWLESAPIEARERGARECDNDNWIEIGQEKLTIEDEAEFCSAKVLIDMLRAKDVFDVMSDRDLREARARANPYETIGGAFFQNRAAMKTANLDKVFDWIFSQEYDENCRLRKNPVDLEAKGENVDREKELFYFADVCAGPGGFSEYMLWRKGFFNTKGFGFTLAGKDDFKLGKFTASSAQFFEPFYGKYGDGDVMNPENIESLQRFIEKGTNGGGVHLMMADGGFSVEGRENIQEILSKRLYLCQLLVSLCIVREGGNFFCKLFDIFTPFSAGLVYLMYLCYDRISLHKPHTSRPANSERYIICQGLRKEYSDPIRDYLKRINLKLDGFKKAKSTEDVNACVPLDIMRDDDAFFSYLVGHNEAMARRQTMYLHKYQSYSRNPGLIDKDQADLREECLKYWMIPNRNRQRDKRDREDQRNRLDPNHVIAQYIPFPVGEQDLSKRAPEFNADILRNPSEKQLKYAEWSCALSTDRAQPQLLVSTGDSVFMFDRNWNNNSINDIRIPDKTILLVEKTHVFEYVIDSHGNKKLSDTRKTLIRILDAAVLHGDDVSSLPYEKRMQAAKKFCNALKRVEPTIRIGYGDRARTFTPTPVVVAEVLSVEDLPNIKPRLTLVRFQGSELMTFEQDGYTLQCLGVRFARNIKAEWKMSWSKTHRRYFAFNGNKSYYDKDLESHKINATFWDNYLIRQSRLGPSQLMQCFWKWYLLNDSGYGCKAIVEDETHPGGLTLKAIAEIVEAAKRQNHVNIE